MSQTTPQPDLPPDPPEGSAPEAATPEGSPPEAATPQRRRFTAAYKAEILAECDVATAPGGVGAILRREGLYSSHLVEWRRRRAEDGVEGLAPRKMGRPPKEPGLKAQRKENERLRRENALLKEKLRRSEIIVEAQKKLAEMLAPLSEPLTGSAA